MKGSFINSTKVYRILCLLSEEDATLRELATYFVEEEKGEVPIPEKQDDETKEMIEQQERNLNHQVEEMLDENLITSYKDDVMGEEKRHLSFDTETLVWLWIEKMRNYNSPRKTLENPELKELTEETDNSGIVGKRMSDEEFLHYYKHVKHKEKQTDIKTHEQFNPWYEFDAVAAGHDPHNIKEYLTKEFEKHMNDGSKAHSTIQEMFEAVEDKTTTGKVTELLNLGSTGERDAEEVIATAVTHQATTHDVEINEKEYIIPHIGSFKDQKTIPILNYMKDRWENFEGGIKEFIREQTGKEPEVAKDQRKSTTE